MTATDPSVAPAETVLQTDQPAPGSGPVPLRDCLIPVVFLVLAMALVLLLL